ncbi:acyltransferase family protein [Xaviernesmea oryzae]|uniref:acyltransferase family protein n=1 Tax=Xaviernesmea oryzae TaxID=464029 RepID=UPI0008BD1E3B|nr:acyltransferase [Xaviernesmea oryzae]SEK24155.1 Peptidoglycan/LPS O-acetylase OafA/YrhL, contains acyltransferase and SGNH-hydrolase domains [Xaviernesmea oryzae]
MVVQVQYLRALAAFGVIFFHAFGYTTLDVVLQEKVKIGAAGVDLFFIISGFVMYLSTVDRQIGTAAFYKARLIRVVPLYWLATSLAVAIFVAAPQLTNHPSTWQHILSSYLFVAHPDPSRPDLFWPIVVPGWTLNYEMFFYLLFGLSLLLPKRAQIPNLAVTIGGLVAIGLIAHPPGIAGFYTHSLLLEFLLGLLFGALYRKGVRLDGRLCLSLSALALLSLLLLQPYFSEQSRVIFWGIPAAMLFCGSVFAKGSPMRLPIVEYLGAASYSLYLSQFFSLKVFEIAARILNLPRGLMFVLVSVTLAIIVGVLVYAFIEVPITRLLKPRARLSLQEKVSPVTSAAG